MDWGWVLQSGAKLVKRGQYLRGGDAKSLEKA